MTMMVSLRAMFLPALSVRTKAPSGQPRAKVAPTVQAVVRPLAWLAALSLAHPSHAVLFDSTGSSTHNTTAPTGTLLNSGWQYQGQWGGFLGTAISPNHFVTAKHIGGTVGNGFTFNFDSTTYTTTAKYDDPNSDLTIWRVSGTLPAYAPLYTGSSEVGQNLVVFGRGTQRGGAVLLGGTLLRGWLWGAADGVQRWGENQVAGIAFGGAGIGQLLRADFNAGAGVNEAHLSDGDSGGGVFIQEGGIWKLAGINYAVDGLFSFTGGSDLGFSAALFDAGGLYVGSQNNWTFLADVPADIATSFYATRISANQTWIQQVIPEPSGYAGLAAIGLLGLALARRCAGIQPPAPRCRLRPATSRNRPCSNARCSGRCDTENPRRANCCAGSSATSACPHSSPPYPPGSPALAKAGRGSGPGAARPARTRRGLPCARGREKRAAPPAALATRRGRSRSVHR